MVRSSPRPGFSLIEALVVLAIGGMALAIIFSIGLQAGDSGFSLGRRAMAAADSDIASSDLRAVIRSLAVRPPAMFAPEIDEPIRGQASRLEGDLVMERATQCGPRGWSGRLVLAIEPRGPGRALVCEAADRRATLITSRSADMAFSYSEDGVVWSDQWTNAPTGRDSVETQPPIKVYVRLKADAATDIVESASSGPVRPWARIETYDE